MLGEPLDAVHAEHVLLHSPGEDVAGIGRDFTAGDDHDADFVGDLLNFIVRPERVVLGEGDPVESGFLGADGEIPRVEHRVVRSAATCGCEGQSACSRLTGGSGIGA